jgi:hypothetical protein
MPVGPPFRANKQLKKKLLPSTFRKERLREDREVRSCSFIVVSTVVERGTLSVKWTSFYVVYSGGCKCNSLWPASLRSSRTADRAYSFTKYVILCRTLPKFTLPPHGNLRIYYVFLINLILHEPRSIC